mgnify:CR=1 FL=1
MAHAVGMMRLLRRAADELDRTFVVVLHDLNAAAVYSDHMVAMADGRVVAAGKTTDLMRDDLLSEVFGLPIEVHEVAGRPQAVFYTR